MLTDDKTYPYLKITNEKHPRLITTRKVKRIRQNILVLIRMPMRQVKRKAIGSIVSAAQMCTITFQGLLVLSHGSMLSTLCEGN